MASSKKRRKDRKYALGPAAKPARVRDGDRRRRAPVDLVREAIARKRWLQQGGDPMPPPDDPA